MRKLIVNIFVILCSICIAATTQADSLPSGGSVSGHLAAGDIDPYTFTGNAGEAVTIVMEEHTTSYGQIYIYKPDGSYWTYAKNLAHLTLPVSGTYTATVKFSSTAQSGNYTIRYVRGGDSVENGVLTSGETASANLQAFDIDSFTFGGGAGEAVTLMLDESASSYGQMYFYKPDGSYWTYANNLAHLTLPQTGSYTVVVRLSTITQQGDYDLHFVLGGDAIENTLLVSGETHSETLTSYDLDSYNFIGNAGEAITLIMDEDQSSYGQMYFYKPDGSYWTYANNLAHLTLPQTGQYTVVVRYSTITQAGDYALHYLRGGDEVENGDFTSGATRTGNLATLDMDSYNFSGNAGEAITLIMDEDQSSYGQMYFYKPDGSYWTYANNLAHLTLPQTGEYTVVVRYSTITHSGDYSLHFVHGGNNVENGGLNSGATRTGNLTSLDMDSYNFSGNAGEAITLIMDEDQSSYGQLYFYKPDGSYWTYANNLAHLTLPQSGEYTVVVRYSNITHSGDYALHFVRGGDNVENGNLSSGSTQSSNLTNYDMDSYTFSALAQQEIVISLSESVSSYGQIFVYKPDGSYWTYGNNYLNVTLPTSGTYTVIVRYSTITHSGPYSLSYAIQL